MCALGPDPVFAVYSAAETFGKAAGSGPDMAAGMQYARVVIYSEHLEQGNLRFPLRPLPLSLGLSEKTQLCYLLC